MLSAFVTLAMVLPAVAAANCVTNSDGSRDANILTFSEGYYHDDSTPFTIVKANIAVRDPELAPNCSTYNCWSWAWVMMDDANLSGSGGWAQVGPFHGQPNSSWGTLGAGTNWDQCVLYDSNGMITHLYDNTSSSSSIGATPLYAVQQGTDPTGKTNNKIFYINGNLYDYCGVTTDYNFSPTEASAAGEITDAQTQLPGGTTAVEQWTNGRLADGNHGFDWFSGGSTYYNSQRTWMGGPNIPQSSVMDTWDKDCP